MLNDINQKYIRPKSGLYFNKNIPLNKNIELSEGAGSQLELIDENSKKIDKETKDDKEDKSSLDDDYTHIDVYDEKNFLKEFLEKGETISESKLRKDTRRSNIIEKLSKM